MSIFTENLEFLKYKFNLSSGRLAQLAGVPTSTISRVLDDAHKPRNATVDALAKAFKITSFDLQFTPFTDPNTSPFNRTDKPPVEAQTLADPAFVKKLQAIVNKENLVPIQDFFDKNKMKEHQDNGYFPITTHVVGAYAVLCTTDDLLPRISRGYHLQIVPIDTKDATQLSERTLFVGKAINENGNATAVMGHLTVSNDKLFIRPTNPELRNNSVEITEIVGKIVGWSYFER